MKVIEIKNLRMRKSNATGYVTLSAADWDVLYTYINKLEKWSLRRLWQWIRKTAIYSICPTITDLDEWPTPLAANEISDLTDSQFRKLRENNPELLGLRPGK